MSLRDSGHIKWLLTQIPRWVEEGIIKNDQAANIASLYDTGRQAPLARTIFTAIGSIFIGLGVILFFAYNWEIIPKYVKLAAIFLSIAEAHATAYYFYGQGESREQLAQGLFILGTMLFGAGIWLVAQVYHIDEHYPNGLLAWGMGAWVLAWSLRSVPHCLLVMVILCFWYGFEALDFDRVLHFAPFLILACGLPLAWLKRSQVLLVSSAVAFFAAIIVPWTDYPFAMSMIFLSSACLLMIAIILEQGTVFPESASSLYAVGLIPFLLILYVFSFEDSSDWFFNHSGWHRDIAVAGHAYFWTVCTAVVILSLWAAYLLYRKKKSLRGIVRIEFFSIIFMMAISILKYVELLTRHRIVVIDPGLPTEHTDYMIPFDFGLDGWTLASLFNLLFLGHSIYLIWDGINRLDTKRIVAGIVLTALLVFSRYVDLFESLLARSLVFLIVGISIFTIGVLYSRIKKDREVAS